MNQFETKCLLETFRSIELHKSGSGFLKRSFMNWINEVILKVTLLHFQYFHRFKKLPKVSITMIHAVLFHRQLFEGLGLRIMQNALSITVYTNNKNASPFVRQIPVNVMTTRAFRIRNLETELGRRLTIVFGSLIFKTQHSLLPCGLQYQIQVLSWIDA